MGYAFISFSSKHMEMATSLNDYLNKNGVDTWIAYRDIAVGEEYPAQIVPAIRNCSCVVLLLTAEAQASKWVKKEIERVIHYEKPLIVIQLKDVVLNDSFEFFISDSQIVYIDSYDENSNEMKSVLKWAKSKIGINTQENTPSMRTAGEPIIIPRFIEKKVTEKTSPVVNNSDQQKQFAENKNKIKQSMLDVGVYKDIYDKSCFAAADMNGFCIMQRIVERSSNPIGIYLVKSIKAEGDKSRRNFKTNCISEESITGDRLIIFSDLGCEEARQNIDEYINIAKNQGKRVVVVGVIPFSFEIREKGKLANENLEYLSKSEFVDMLLYFRQDFVDVVDRRITVADAMKVVDYFIINAMEELSSFGNNITEDRYEIVPCKLENKKENSLVVETKKYGKLCYSLVHKTKQ